MKGATLLPMTPPTGVTNPVSKVRSALPRVVIATAWVSFFADLSTEMIYGILPAFYLHTLSLSILSLAWIEGTAESLVALTKLFSGTLSDRTGKRPLWMGVGYGLSGLAKPLVGLASSGTAVGLLRGLDRFGKGLRGAPRDALVASWVPAERRGAAFGLQRALDHAGALCGGLLAALLLATGSLAQRDLFLFSAIPGALAVLVIVLFVRESAPSTPPPASTPFSLRSAWRSVGPGVRSYLLPASVFALAHPSDILLLAISFRRFMESGLSEHAALARLPLLWALLHVVKSIGTAWGGRVSDRRGRIGLLRLAWLQHAGVWSCAAVLAAGAPAALAWPMFAWYGLVSVFGEAPEQALVADLTPLSTNRGAAFGLVHFVRGILALPATLLAAALWQTLGPPYAFAAGSLLALLACTLLHRAKIASLDGS